MKFTFRSESDGTNTTLETPEFESWRVGLFYFQQFLDGCGYVISKDKTFDLVEGDRTYNLTCLYGDLDE